MLPLAAVIWVVSLCLAVAPAHASPAGVESLSPAAPGVADLHGDVVARPLHDGSRARAAYTLGGGKWSKGQVPYFLAAGQHRWAVKKAVRAWNKSGARVRFKAVRRSKAKLIIGYYSRRVQPRATDQCGSGHATLGYVPGASRVWLPRLTRRSPYADHNCALIVVHELGHVLGLAHEERRCATMNSTSVNLSPRHCPPNREWEWRCRLLERDDVRGVVKRYGGRVRRARTPAMCDFYVPEAPPIDLAATPYFDGAAVSWSRPAASPVPAWLLGARSTGGFQRVPSYAVAAARDVCPAAPAVPSYGYPGGLGETASTYVALGDPGRYCIVLQTFDELARPSSGPATVWLDHPPPPPPETE